MRAIPQNKPLTEAEMDRLDEALVRCGDGSGMGMEELDGFFTALIVGPDTIMPSKYLPEIFGGDIAACPFESEREFEEIVALLMRHWNSIAATFNADKPHIPTLWEDENRKVGGNEWAHGFMRGVALSSGSWDDLMDFDNSPGYLFPMMYFDHEHDPDPELRPPAPSPEKREELLAYLGAMPLLIYRHYKDRRLKEAHRQATGQSSNRENIGRNQPCPCGSGKKYKRCHGAASN